MAQYDYDVIVIGGGAGGLTASTFAGQSAAKTLLIEKEEKLGGDCLHYGCVPSKSLIKSAYVYNAINNTHKYGLPRAAIEPVDFVKIRDRIRTIIGKIQEHDEPEYIEEKYNVETKFGSPQFVDDRTIDLNGEKMTGRYFIIATGSSPFVPPIEGIEGVKYLTNVDIFSLDQLPQRLIVMGGGPIGMEMAQAFSRLGSEVTVLEGEEHFLVREDADIAGFVKERMESEGIDIRLNSLATKAEQKGDTIAVTVKNPKTEETQIVEGDTLLVAVGRKANVDGLSLEKAGVVFDRTINVDRKMRTNKKHIYAVGDVNGGYQFTHVASYEAIIAITNAIYKFPSKADYIKIPWVTYLDPEIASIGYNELRAKEAGIDYIKHVETFDHNDRALAEGENKGMIKILMNKKGRVIGVQIAAFHAGDLIAEWIPVINGNGKLSMINNAVHPYPTMAEMNKNVGINYFVSTLPDFPKKLYKWIFGYQGKI